MPLPAAQAFGCKGFAMNTLRRAALLALLLLSCAPDEVPAAAAAPQDALASAAGFPRDVALPGGGVLRVPAPPQRVVVSSSGLGDLVCELLPPEALAGLPDQMRSYSGRRAPDDPYL